MAFRTHAQAPALALAHIHTHNFMLTTHGLSSTFSLHRSVIFILFCICAHSSIGFCFVVYCASVFLVLSRSLPLSHFPFKFIHRVTRIDRFERIRAIELVRKKTIQANKLLKTLKARDPTNKRPKIMGYTFIVKLKQHMKVLALPHKKVYLWALFFAAILLHHFSFRTLSLLLYAMNVKQKSEVKERLDDTKCVTRRNAAQHNTIPTIKSKENIYNKFDYNIFAALAPFHRPPSPRNCSSIMLNNMQICSSVPIYTF